MFFGLGEEERTQNLERKKKEKMKKRKKRKKTSLGAEAGWLNERVF